MPLTPLDFELLPLLLPTLLGFLLAGPEFTPGFSPVWILGEFEPDVNEALFVRPELDLSFDFVLLIVIFMPSELCLTMYSEGGLLVGAVREKRSKKGEYLRFSFVKTHGKG